MTDHASVHQFRGWHQHTD